MSGLEFVIPLRREDLLQRAGVTQYVVDEVFPVRSLAQKLQGILSSYIFLRLQLKEKVFLLFFALLCRGG